MVGHPPFNEDNFMRLMERVTNCDFHLPPDLDPDAADIIRALLKKNPDQRLGASSGFSKLKSHPFFTKIDFQKLSGCAEDPVWKPS